MDNLQTKEIVCKHCHEIFPSKGKYDYHVRRDHQNEVKIHGFDQGETSIHRSGNEKFTCICDKSYAIWQSLYRHQKGCQQWKEYKASIEVDSDSEMSIRGNIYKYLA